MKWLITLILLQVPLSISRERVTINYKVEFEKITIRKEIKFSREVNELANFIKKHEGLVLKPYYCPGGYLSIGYGHCLTKTDKFDSITVYQADSILKSDIQKTMSFVIQRLPELKGNKRIAITHFVFAVGSGNLLKSTLYKNLKSNQDITNSLLVWNKIKGKTSKQLEKQRMWELNKFYNE